ncbi:MAG: flippase-like domain-containing protein [Chloroflexota bacterium]|nr:flippase-like domain-containing protein [Chloroflexota bacterium]
MISFRSGDDSGGSTGVQRLWISTLVGAVIAVAVVTGLALFGDVQQLAAALQDFTWWLAVPILALTLINYLLRFVKWEIYLRRLAIPPLGLGTSVLIFLSGFSMSLTPGKVGEMVKALLLNRLTGEPVGRTSAIIAAERLTDGLAMLVLASLGLTQFAYGRTLLAVAALGALLLVALLRRPRLLTAVLRHIEHWPLVGRGVEQIVAFVHASNDLLGLRLLSGAVGLGIVSWAGECLAFFLVLVGLDVDPSWHLLLAATFILAVSSIVGAVSMLPGGLGVTEASMAGMLLLLPSDAMQRSTAVAATLLIRFSTLWFAVILGTVALVIIQRRVTAEMTRRSLTGQASAPS